MHPPEETTCRASGPARPRDVFWLYRPTLPSVRAQSIQVVNMAHAMAAAGHRVTLLAEPGERGRNRADALAFYGLEPTQNLDLRLLRGGRTAASVAFRLGFMSWLGRTGGEGIAYARSKRYADEALGWAAGRFRLVLEAHEVDSSQAAERGEDPTALFELERRVLGAAKAVVTNAPGTLEILREQHSGLPPAIALHNATHPSRARMGRHDAVGVGYVGSVLPEKDIVTLARAARRAQLDVTVVGPAPSLEVMGSLTAISGGYLRFEGPIAHRDVPDRLARFRVLVLPLAAGLFGERLTSPLKLWDYLASGVPIVAPNLPWLAAAAPDATIPYSLSSVDELASALRLGDGDDQVRGRVVRAARVRTWATRAQELTAFMDRVIA